MYKSVNTITLASVERKKINFYLKNILPMPQNTVGIISSRGGMGKTFLSLRIASDFIKETGKRALVWFSEDEPEIIAFRFDALVKEFNIDKDTQKKIDYITTSPKQFAIKEKGVFKANNEAVAELRKDCISNNVGLIVIDPLLAFYGGDENDNSQARVFMQVFLDWAKQDGVNILSVHHAQKGDGSSRGAGAFIDACRYAYELHYPKTDKDEIDFDKKDKGIREVRLTKDNHNAYYHFSKLFNGDGVGEMKVLPAFSNIPDIKVEEVTFQAPSMPDFNDNREPIDTVTISIADHNSEHNPHGFVKKHIRWDDLLDTITMGKAYAPAGFKDGHRKRENYLLDTNVVFLDIDDGMSLNEAQTMFANLKCFYTTTRSHQKEKVTKAGIVKPAIDRFRVAIKLDSPINLADGEYQIAMQSIFDYFGSVDRSTKDPSRFYFSSPSDCEVWFSQGTTELNWRELYEKAKKIRAIEQQRRIDTANERESTADDIEKALNRIDADCVYQTWVECGMALKSELGDAGFDIWDSWSARGRGYVERDMMPKWNSFKGGSISIGTLFYHSKGL